MAQLTDALARKRTRVAAYENRYWATRAPAWRDVWWIVAKAGRLTDQPNLSLRLDTFQSAETRFGGGSGF